MNDTDPLAFFSYVQSDDKHENGRLTALRERLEGEVRMHTGSPFVIFQDRRDIKWGQAWQKRLDSTLLNVTFLIPIITPSYFQSSACRKEFDTFRIRERQLGEDRLILPIYYLEADRIVEANLEDPDPIAQAIASRNWADWRDLRFEELTSAAVGKSLSAMGSMIKAAMKEINTAIAASATTSSADPSSPILVSETIAAKDDSGTERVTRLVPIFKNYHVFTTEYDEEVYAPDLMDASNLIRLGPKLRRFSRDISSQHAASLATARNRIAEISSAKTPITFLIDNSGSMRGDPIGQVAGWILVICSLLEDLKIPVQVLGFTTRAWKGGQSREKWVAGGKEPNPGRLNDLRHIIYKTFSDDKACLQKNLCLMIRDGLLKENIDGEALLWAQNVCHKPGSEKSILIVVSDGAPVDDSTLSANSGIFLDAHLKRVIKWIVSDKPEIALYGIGLGHDVSLYYPKALFSKKQDVWPQVLDALPIWLNESASAGSTKPLRSAT